MDVTLCTSIECPVKNTCYRAQAKPERLRQKYFNFEYTCHEYNGFVYYIALTLDEMKELSCK